MHFLFLLSIFLYNYLGVFAFLNPYSNPQLPLNGAISPGTENLTLTTSDSAMAEHDGFRTVAYFVNWVRLYVFVQRLSRK